MKRKKLEAQMQQEKEAAEEGDADEESAEVCFVKCHQKYFIFICF